MAPTSQPALKPTARRGRPATRWLSLAEVAEITGLDVETLERVLAKAPGALPGAELDGETWTVHEGRLLKALGVTSALPKMATVDEVAEYLKRSPKTIYGWLQRTGPKGAKLLTHRKVAGTILIPVADVLRLPAKLPDWAAPSFFSSRPRPPRKDSAPAALSFFSQGGDEA